ncbi:MAG TPA: YfiR family protein [Terriglobales bacterium]|nr:YfiR family protein [Terriglobales bacterium]
MSQAHTSRIRLARWAYAAVLLLAAALPPPSPAQSVTASEVKAAFVYNFAKFVDWPPASQPSDAITFCLMGQSETTEVLQRTLPGKTVNARRVALKRIHRTPELSLCQILFLADDAGRDAETYLAESRTLPILSVTEISGMADRGVMIEFVLEENKVRFEINLDSANRAGLKISSKLLSLARVVNVGKGGP